MISHAFWVFVNRDSPDETIQIHDQTSAEALKRLLQKSGGNWEVREQLDHRPPITPPKAKPTAAPPNQERRTQKRYMSEFRVILISGTHSFRTMSEDVSLGGMKLKKNIPANFIENNCIAYISHKDLDENLELICNVIADPKDPCRIKFQKADPEQLNRLNDWLKEQK